MSTSAPARKEEREHARAERKRREEEAALHAQRKRRLVWLGGGLVALIVVVGIVIAVASGGGSSPSSSSSASPNAIAKAGSLKTEFAGIPQKGNVLGSPSAKGTLMVFADMQCPFCRQFEVNAFPQIVKRYVKTGRLKVVFQPISILGNDSVVASRGVAAAAQQNKMFDYASLFYDNQGQENTGYVTSTFLTNLAKSVPGLKLAKWNADLNSPAATSLLSKAQSASTTANVSSTPSFFVAKAGQSLAQFQPSALQASAFNAKLDQITR